MATKDNNPYNSDYGKYRYSDGYRTLTPRDYSGPTVLPFALGSQYGGAGSADANRAVYEYVNATYNPMLPGSEYMSGGSFTGQGAGDNSQYRDQRPFDPSTYDPRVGGAGAAMGSPKNAAAAAAGMQFPSQEVAGGGYNLGGEMNSIAQGYQTRLDELNRQRDAGGVQLAGALQTGRGNLAKRVTDNTAENDKTNSAIQASYAQAMQRQQSESAAMVAELKKMGIDPSRLAPAAAQAASFLEQSGLAQGALTQRMGQISNDTLNARQQSLDLIDTGAQGQLTNNYSQAKMRMDLQRQAQEDQARQASAAAAARAPSEFEQAMNKLKYQEAYNKANGIDPSNPSGIVGTYDLSVLQPGTAAYNVASSGSKNIEADLRRYFTRKIPATDAQGNEVRRDNGDFVTVEDFDQDGFNKAFYELGQSARSNSLLKQGDSSLRDSYESNVRGSMGSMQPFYDKQIEAIDQLSANSNSQPDYSSIPEWARPQSALAKMSFNGR